VTIQSQHVSQLGQGAYRQPFLHDQWAGLTHVIGAGQLPTLLAPGIGTWLPKDDRRRLLAYQVLQAYADNVRRHWLPSHMWRAKPVTEADGAESPVAFPQALQYREYGDPQNLIDTARSLVLGDEQRFRVPDAEPAKNPGGELVTPGAGSLPVEVQEYLKRWFEKEKVGQKLVEAENRTITLGDSVLVLHWDGDVKRPRLSGYDPGFYFPHWDAITSKEYVQLGWKDADYPPVVHLAWQWTDEKDVEWIRRTTWRMRPLDRPRKMPYRDEPTRWTCWYEQADYDPAKIEGSDVYSFPKAAARFLVPPVDLGVDFMPVIGVPNDYPGSNLWGKSILTTVAQILDDIASGDTDLALNAETVASPHLVGKGLTEAPQTGAAGWSNLFAGQDLSLLDTSRTLDALIKQNDRLAQKLARNTRLGQVLLGMVAPDQVPSGYSMRLGFASVEALEREMTAVRRAKYDLLGKMVASFASANQLIPAGPLPAIQMVLGKGLPADRAATLQEVGDLLTKGAISTLTAVMMLMEAGVPIDDAQAEVQRIQSERTEIAVGIVEATGNVEAAAKYLGVPYVEPEPHDHGDEPPAGGGGGFGGDTSDPEGEPPTTPPAGREREPQGDSARPSGPPEPPSPRPGR
jgi:hypothetical protein